MEEKEEVNTKALDNISKVNIYYLLIIILLNRVYL